MNTNKIERAAVRVVEEYIDKCPKLEPYITSNDKTPIWLQSQYHSICELIKRRGGCGPRCSTSETCRYRERDYNCTRQA